jgi:hypothetical protein
MSGHKRSRSEDNILNITDSKEDFCEPLTPQVVGEAMSKDDPFYAPAAANPFAAFQSYGGKMLGNPNYRDSMGFELPSPSDALTPPCTPITPDSSWGKRQNTYERRSQSLPSSPVLLRKAAERFHQESLHGSTSRKNSNARISSAFCPRSKSTIFPEEVAHRLQNEINENFNDKLIEDDWSAFSKTWDVKQSSRNNRKPCRKLYIRRQLSEDSQTNVISTNDNGLNEPQDSSLEGSNECIWNESVKKSNVSYQKSLLPCNEEKLTDLHVNIKKHGDVNGNKKEKTGSDSNKKENTGSDSNKKEKTGSDSNKERTGSDSNKKEKTGSDSNKKERTGSDSNKKEKTGSDSNNKDMSDSQRNGKKHDTVIKLNRTIMETRV